MWKDGFMQKTTKDGLMSQPATEMLILSHGVWMVHTEFLDSRDDEKW